MPAVRLEEFRDGGRGAGGTVAFDRRLRPRLGELARQRGGDALRRGGPVVHRAAGAVALEPVADVDVLLEVAGEREREERPARGGQLHAGREAALDDGDVARGEVAREPVDVAVELEALVRGERLAADARAADDDHPEAGDQPA